MSNIWQKRSLALARKHPAMKIAKKRWGVPQINRREPSSFQALARAIVFQQLSTKAATTIYARLKALTPIRAEDIYRARQQDLRAAGISGNKFLALRDLAEKSLQGEVPLRSLWRYSDDEVIERLVKVRGIGVWSAQMFLIFHLERPDVWPVGDLGVQEGYRLMSGEKERRRPKELEACGEAFRKNRSSAAWYLWRISDAKEFKAN